MTSACCTPPNFVMPFLYKIIPRAKAGRSFWRRLCFTAFARDSVRGVDRKWVRDVAAWRGPDMALYFRVPIEVSVERLLAGG